MKKLPLNSFAYSDVFASGIGERNTVSNGPDDGANNLMASHFWNVKRHGTTAEAVNNGLVAPLTAEQSIAPFTSAGGLNIGGHGNEGQLETGAGQHSAYDGQKWVLLWNEYIWDNEVERLGPTPITVVTIWSCHTGAGEDGADLLFALAKRAGRAVRARTGFTYVSSKELTFENGSVWQVATPEHRPAAIAAPTPHLAILAQLEFETASQRICPVSDIATLQVFPAGPHAWSGQAKSVTGLDAMALATALFHPAPMDMQLSVMGFVTARIQLGFTNGEGIEFTVYNDRLAVDHHRHTGYYLKSGFSAFMRASL